MSNTKGLATFSRDIEMEYWAKMGYLRTLDVVGLKVITHTLGNQTYIAKVTDQNVLEKNKRYLL